jgi:hypothetical protein
MLGVWAPSSSWSSDSTWMITFELRIGSTLPRVTCKHPACELSVLRTNGNAERLHERSVDVRRCPDAETNCSDSPECPESTSGCRGTSPKAGAPGGNRSIWRDVDFASLKRPLMAGRRNGLART